MILNLLRICCKKLTMYCWMSDKRMSFSFLRIVVETVLNANICFGRNFNFIGKLKCLNVCYLKKLTKMRNTNSNILECLIFSLHVLIILHSICLCYEAGSDEKSTVTFSCGWEH